MIVDLLYGLLALGAALDMTISSEQPKDSLTGALHYVAAPLVLIFVAEIIGGLLLLTKDSTRGKKLLRRGLIHYCIIGFSYLMTTEPICCMID